MLPRLETRRGSPKTCSPCHSQGILHGGSREGEKGACALSPDKLEQDQAQPSSHPPQTPLTHHVEMLPPGNPHLQPCPHPLRASRMGTVGARGGTGQRELWMGKRAWRGPREEPPGSHSPRTPLSRTTKEVLLIRAVTEVFAG